MPKLNPLPRRWRELSITTKFALSSGTLLALIVLVALTGYIASTVVRRQTEAAIVTSMEVQRLVLKMDAGLQSARLFERDFFLRWPTVGFVEAQATYAQGNDQQIAEVVALSARLKEIISASDVSEALRESDVNLNFYLSAADRYAATFDEAVELVAGLAAPDTGAQVRLVQHALLLHDALVLADDPALIVLYREMQTSEKDYLVTRQRPNMQSAFNVALMLRKAMNESPSFDSDQRAQALSHLDDYLAVADEILTLDVEIRSKFNEFDLQAQAVDPISAELIALANDEVQRARNRIDQTSQLATLLLVVAVVAAVILAGFIAWVQNDSVTRNIVKLTKVAHEMQAGDLDARVQIDSADELGQLGNTFNTLAEQLHALIDNLEEKVAERTAELASANKEIRALNEKLKEENLRLGAELEVTRQLQRMILPNPEELAAIAGLDIAGYMEPADEVGGDYYDVLHSHGAVKIGIGDVTDHGLESGVVMLMTQTAVRTLLNNGETDPVRFLDTLNRTVYGNVQRMNTDRNLTLSLLDYTNNGAVGGQIRLSGQHEEMIVVRQDSRIEVVDTSDLGFPIGLDDDIADFVDQTTVNLEPGDGVVLFTDGITEAENLANEQYGMDRLCQVIGEQWSGSAETIKEVIIADVQRHIGEQEVFDDITLVVAKQK